MSKLIVISGPANSGKFPLAKKLLSEDPRLILVHRDSLRDAIINKMDEWEITRLMEQIVIHVLMEGYNACVCAWNLEPEDRQLWEEVSKIMEAELTWLDTREPAVQAMIPPL